VGFQSYRDNFNYFERGEEMIIKCGECAKEISNKAQSCPGCGCPINQNVQKNEVQIIEKTCKKHKAAAIWAFLLIVLGFLLICSGEAGAPWGGLSLLVALGLCIYSRRGS